MPTTYAIINGAKAMDATLYTGDGSNNRTITNQYGFLPDFTWIKSRSNVLNNNLYDTDRGAPNEISSNTTSGDTSGDLIAFTSTGFTINQTTGYEINHSGYTYVAWQWNAGSNTTASNTSGTITSTVSANATAGFSIVKASTTTIPCTLGHGLGATPNMIMFRQRNNTDDWWVWHSSLPSTTLGYVRLNTTAAAANSTGAWNSTAPTSSVFSLGTSTAASSSTIVAYCWTAIPGFSAFGSYTGNGSTDGPFLYLGFRPKYVMIKRTDTTGNWIIFDSARGAYNLNGPYLYANATDAEATSTSVGLDFLSNGFKNRNTYTDTNASGGSYIYAAFAETPFKYANAR
jgi:hypothetical protein